MKAPVIETIKPNFTLLTLGNIAIWYSYKTPIAFQEGEQPLCSRVNDWSNTTGKHLNYIDADKSIRVSGEDFDRNLAYANQMNH